MDATMLAPPINAATVRRLSAEDFREEQIAERQGRLINLVEPIRGKGHKIRYTKEFRKAKRDREFAGGTAGNNISVSGATDPGTRTDAVETYMIKYNGMSELLKGFGLDVVRGSGRTDEFAYPLSAGYPKRQDRGDAPEVDSTEYQEFDIEYDAFAIRAGVHVDDVEDDRTGTAMTVLDQYAENFATLIERIFFQYIQGATDNDLLETLPNAPDGAPLYNATAAGSNRFGASGGNIVTYATNPDAQDIISLYQDVKARFRRFKNTKNEPLFDPSVIDEGITMCYGPALEREMKEAFMQTFTFQSDANGAAAPTNIILDGGDKTTMYPTQRITDKSIYFFLNSRRIRRPLMWGIRRDLYTVLANEQNSDWARDTNSLFTQSRMRATMRAQLPLGSIKGDPSV